MRRVAAVAVTATVLALAGCTAAVEVTAAPQASGAGCTAAARAWPQVAGGLGRREVTAGATAAAAWGDPAVIARCGVPAPGPTSAGCVEVDGVGWIATPLSDGTRFTSFGTEPAIEVLVPRAHSPGGLLLPKFTAAAKALSPNGRHCR